MAIRLLPFVLSLALVLIAEGRLFAKPGLTDNDVYKDESSDSSSLSNLVSSAASTNFSTFVASSKNASMCDHIRPNDLPEECTCSEPAPYSLVIECLKDFNSTYLNDTIGMKIDLDPCNEDGAKLTLDVTEKEHDIDFPIAGIRAGESKNIPIPGLAMIVPGVGNVGMDVAVLIAGNPDKLRLKIGLNACAQLSTDHQLCASSIPGLSSILPWWVLKGDYSFGDVCGTMAAHAGYDTGEGIPTIATE